MIMKGKRAGRMGPRPGELEVNSNRRATVGLCTVGHSGVSLGLPC